MEDARGSSRAAIARRLIVMIDLLGRGDSHLAMLLGYANATTIHKLRRGETLLGPRRLSKLASLDVEPFLYPNLHWILTGKGPVVTHRDWFDSPRARALTKEANEDAAAVEFHARAVSDPEAAELVRQFKSQKRL